MQPLDTYWYTKTDRMGLIWFYGQGFDHQDFFCHVGCCACGGQAVVRHGATVEDCGCGISKLPNEPDKKHPLFSIWQGMIRRCDPWRGDKDYGLRGIQVCDRWRCSFWLFVSDVGERPSKGHSLDRKDVNGDYEPKNVRWATAAEQARNKRNNRWVKIRGRRLLQSAWAKALRISSEELWLTACAEEKSIERVIRMMINGEPTKLPLNKWKVIEFDPSR